MPDPKDPRSAALEIMRGRLCAERPFLHTTGLPEDSQPGAALLAAMRPDGAWDDVNYACDQLKNWEAVVHLTRLLELVRGWSASASPVRGDPRWLAAVLRGLDCWYQRQPQNPNWWWNQIGAPTVLGNILLYLKGACDLSYITRAIPPFTCHEPATRFTGQNLVWVATVSVMHGILTDNPDRVSQAYLLIGKEVNVFTGEEGIQPDMSFHQHGRLLYSGGYGQGFAEDVGRIVRVAAGTPYAWPQQKLDLLLRFLLDGSRWMVRGNTFEYGADGREITRQGHSAERFFAGMRQLADVSHPRRQEVQDIVACQDPRGRSFVTGNRHFWCSDLMVQHRAGYYVSVRLPSTRIENADWPCCGGEGRLCHHMAEGATFILRDGDEYRDLFPVWNWRQVPGTTVVQNPGEFDAQYLRGFGARDFAGGVSDDRVGCAAMDFSRFGLTARKAWFLFEEGFVALGTGISVRPPAVDGPVRTTLNQCHWRGPVLLGADAPPLVAGDYALTPGTTVWHDGVSYRVLDGTGSLRLGPQSGAWSDCGVGSPERLTLPVFNAGLDHGVQPKGATYAYAVVPGVPRERAGSATAFPVQVVCNDAQLQAVWHAGENRGHAVFYEPGEVTFPDGQSLTASLACILLYRPLPGGTLCLTVAQPAQTGSHVTFRLSGPVTAAVGVSLPQYEYAGSSVTVTVAQMG